jgi:ATP-dependent helicase/nuclease subunit A
MDKAGREQQADFSRLPDREDRDLILRELDRSILVEAAAGTGKTASIVGRMLALLRSGKCDSIRTMAAVTFTRKAAAELRARFQVELEKAVRESGGDEKKRLEAALTHVEQCFVGTIHSFCARLLRERPVEAGVDLAFEELDEEVDRRLRAETWEKFAAGLIADDTHGFLEGLSRLGLSLADLRGAFESFADFPDVDEWPRPQAKPQTDFERVRGELDRYLARISELAPLMPQQAGNDTLIPEIKRLPRIISHFDELGRPDQLMEALELFDKSTKVVQKEWKKTGCFSGEDAKEELAAWEAFREDVVEPALRTWREQRYVAVIPVFEAAREQYDALRRERGQLNFQDLLMKAASLLRDNAAVRRYFQSRFTHLLVDEFQDTDPIQAEVILLLCSSDPGESDWRACAPRPGSIFLVGDPKQSIYRFRRADIVTYDEAKGILRASGGEVVELKANFRAAPPLISWINNVFEPGDPACDASGRALLRFPANDTEESPSYIPLLPGREEGATGELCGVYRLQIPEGFTSKGGAVEYEAGLIARFIRYALDGGVTIPRTRKQLSAGKSSEVGPDDFMIVARNTANLNAYAQALELYGIPHRVTGGWALNELNELRLFRDCLRAVVHPDDPVALVAALRGELFGLSDRALYAFRKAGGFFSYNTAVPAALAPEHAQAFGDVFARLKSYSLWLSRLPFAAACEKIAADLGLPALAASRPAGDVQAGSLGKALDLLRGLQGEVWSATQLAEHLGRLVEREEKHDGISALSGAHPAVRIMNLHKAKGLEAPVVFLADPSGESDHPVEKHIDRSGNTILGYLAIYRGGTQFGRGTLLAHPADWDSLAEREKRFERAEALRLRYVAATRAGSATIITQRAKQNRYNPWCHFETHLDEGCELPDPGPQSPPETDRVALTPQEAGRAAADILARLKASREPTYDARPLKEYALSHGAGALQVGIAEGVAVGAAPPAAPQVEGAAMTRSGHPASSAPSGEHGVEWGEVVHILLRAAMDEPRADLERLAAGALAEIGLAPSLAPQAAALAASVTSSEIWRRAMQSETRFVEVPLQALWHEGLAVPTILRGAIDLVFEEKDGWVLVDYKTDRPGSKGLDGAARKYAAQVRFYAQAWERCTGKPVKETYLYFTSTAALVKIQ